MNREQRRHPEKETPAPAAPAREPAGNDRTPDTIEPRAKGTGHGKKTADKWNQ
jgi:hypothetical protein